MTSTAAPLGMTPRSWLDLGVLSFLWGLSFLFYDMALDGLSPLAVVFGRCGVAALFLLVMLRATGVRLPRDPKLWMALAVMGLLNNALPFFLIVNGQSQPGFHGGMSSIFNSTVPLFTVIIAQFFLADEKITIPKIAGILLGMSGRYGDAGARRIYRSRQPVDWRFLCFNGGVFIRRRWRLGAAVWRRSADADRGGTADFGNGVAGPACIPAR